MEPKVLRVKATTALRGTDLHQTVSIGGRSVAEYTVELQDKAIREALIKLGWTPPTSKRCYQCDALTDYLFPDSRCIDCTRILPEEL